jgi:phosphatidylethanolamine-binding protein (PEBP) family uncharacterized protein
MRRTRHTAAIAMLLSTLVLTGCGTGTGATVKPTTVPLTSPAIHAGRLPALYTCDGKNISPPLTWGTISPIIQELALYAIEYASSPTGHYTLGVEWAIAGVNPALHHLNAGEIPRGAFLLKATYGNRAYNICPPRGQTKHYQFALYAIPVGVRVSPELGATELLTNLTNPNPKLQAPVTGILTATYTRR